MSMIVLGGFKDIKKNPKNISFQKKNLMLCFVHQHRFLEKPIKTDVVVDWQYWFS